MSVYGLKQETCYCIEGIHKERKRVYLNEARGGEQESTKRKIYFDLKYNCS